MFEALRNHAIDKVWCSPKQDNQIILSPARITRKSGDLVTTVVMSRRLPLPDRKSYYHVFYVGYATPEIMGLLPMNPQWAMQPWVKMTDAVNGMPLFCDVYTDNGVKVPLNNVYYQYTVDRALVFCVEDLDTLDAVMEQEQIYFRFYTNAYYDTAEANTLTMNTRVVSEVIYNMGDVLRIQSIESTWKQGGGAVFSYVNGNLVDGINPFTVKIGDRVESLYDPSVKEVVDFKLSELKAFTSIRDQKQKYLIHRPFAGSHHIDYVDDIDVYVVNVSGQRHHGRLLHRNQAETMRMVTHRDYSLMVENVVGTGLSLASWLSSNGVNSGDVYIRLYIRKSGLSKELPFESNRLLELYKLSDDKIMNAMIGVNTGVPGWRAENLENSDFVKLLDVKYSDINIELIQSAFGYNAISKTLADTPIYQNDSNAPEAFILPVGLRDDSTVFEFDDGGKLLGYSHHTTGMYHIAQFADTSFIHAIVGKGSHASEAIFGMDNIQLPIASNYRVFMAYGQGSLPTTPWIDITGKDYYHIENGVLKWDTTDEDYILMVRSDLNPVVYSYALIPVAGTLYFPLTEMIDGMERELMIPYADIDLWMNGHYLTRGLDYVIDFPTLHIFNKSYLKQPAGSTPQEFTICMRGLPSQINDLKKSFADASFDKGFIEHGVLSDNNRYDVRDDRVMVTYVDGCLKKRSDLIFSEQHDGISVVNALNGQPYLMKEVEIPLRGFTEESSSSLRKKALEMDEKISNYMTLALPEPERNAVSAIQKRHTVFSPFFCHLINDLSSGQFTRSLIQKPLTDADVIEICEPYKHLLDNDPLNEAIGIDTRMVLIHPHQLNTTILLDVEAYAFIKHVVKVFGKQLISINGHLNVNIKE